MTVNLQDVRALILDDEPDSLAYSKAALAALIPEENICAASSVVEAMGILEGRPVDIAFLDIEMPDTNGFSVAEYVHSAYPDIPVVFLTGHVELGFKSFDYQPFDFLSKPVDVLRLRKTLERFLTARRGPSVGSELVAVETGAGLVMLSPADILYIAKEKRHTVIHCPGKSYAVPHSLDELEIIFSDYGLYRTHQSFLVPLRQIVSVAPADFGKTYFAKLTDGSQVPVSRIQYSRLRDHLVRQGIRIL